MNYNSTLALKIISFLNSTNSENLKYIVLLGSSKVVPPSFYNYIPHINEYESWIPTDFFYLSPDYDLIPNFAVGRLPARNLSEANKIVEKIKEYANESNNGNFENTAVVGGRLWGDESFYAEMLSADVINNNLLSGNISKFYRTDDKFKKNEVKKIFSGNYSAAFIFAHGNGKCLNLDGGNLCTDDLENLNKSSKIPVIFSVSCENGAYDSELTDEERSISEELIISNAGGIAYFGSSRIAYLDWDIYLNNGYVKKIVNRYMDNLIEKLLIKYKEKEVLGDMEKDAMLNYVAENDIDNMYSKITLFEFVLIGDPALKIKKANKSDIESKPLVTINSNISVGYSVDEKSKGKMPAFIIDKDKNVTIFCNYNSENLTLKIIDTSKYENEVVEKISLNAQNNQVNFTFTPKNTGLYLVRCVADNDKEGWSYFRVNDGVFFTDNYSDFGSDTNNNSLYDDLIVNVSVYANNEGYYKISGRLYNKDCMGWWCSSIYTFNETYLKQGINIVRLKFDGTKIYKTNYNGKYVLKDLYLYNSWWNQLDYRSLAYTTSSYNYTQFEKGSLFTGNYSDFGIDLNNNLLYDEFIINVSVYIAKEGDYRIYGYLYKENCDSSCYVGYASNETHLKNGTNIVKLKFDGGEIYKSGYNGKFVLRYLYLYNSWWDQLDYKSLAYTTASYNYTQFEKDTSFTGEYSDFGSDINNNSLYDYFVINVSVFIKDEGDYRIYGYLYEEDCQSWSCDYVYVSNETHLKQGTNIVQLKFDGTKIYKTNYNGKFVLKYLYLYNSWNQLDYKSLAYTTASYNYTQFEKGSLFTGNYSDFGIDLNNNSLYDEFIINVSVYIAKEGDYRIYGYLYKENCDSSCYVGYASNETHLKNGTNIVQLKFDGGEIYKSGYNGKFVLKYLYLYKKEESYWGGYWWNQLDYKSLAYTTASYNYTQFEKGSLFTGNYSDFGIDLNNNSLYDYLVINVSVYISKEGDYKIYGKLYEDCSDYYYYCNYITYAQNETHLKNGTNIVQLKFKGSKIYRSNFNGKFVLKYLYLYEKEEGAWNYKDYKYTAYITSYYNYTQFEKYKKPQGNFTGNYFDETQDVDNDGLYDYLTINIQVNVSDYGNYIIYGRLYKENCTTQGCDYLYAGNTTYLNNGTNTVQLNFDGREIYKLQHNGKFVPKYLYLYDDEGNQLDNKEAPYTTSKYNFTRFERPPAYFAGNYSDFGIDLNNNSLFEYLVINVSVNVSEEGYYEISGQLYKGNMSLYENYISYASNYIYLKNGTNIVQLKFDGKNIYKQNFNGNYILAYLYLYDSNYHVWDRKTIAYNTFYYNYTQFEKTTSFTGNYSDFGIDLNNNSLYDELVINVSVYIDEEGDYKIYGHLYENCSYYWCNYMSASNETHLQQGINMVQLKFDGEKIYKSNYKGSFVLKYLSLDKKEGYWWNQLDYKSLAYITASYNYTQFEKGPSFTGNYSDFGIDLNNNSLYDELVINVSVYVTKEGDYKISGNLYENCQYDSCNYIISASNETHLQQGINIMQLKFDGNKIYKQNYNGKFVLKYLYLYKKEESYWGGYSWNQEDYKYLAYTTLNYNYDQFEKGTSFTDDYSDFGIDLNNNSLYDELVINVSVYIAKEGDYLISGNLYKNCNDYSCYITFTSNETHLQQGINIVQLKFYGGKIYKSNYNGKFLLKYLYLYKKEESYWGGYSWNKEDYITLAHMTSKYNYTQFEKPPQFTDNYSDFGIDLNNNSLYDELVINVSVCISEEGDYLISGYIYEDCGDYWCDFITYASNETHLKNGTNIVQLKFDGGEIYKSGYNGKFVLKYLYLYNGGNQLDYKSLAYTTASYNYTQFEKGPSFTDNYSDFGIDLNNNSLYDYLVINVSVYISEEGDYKIYGRLYENCSDYYYYCNYINYAQNETHLKNGTNIVQLKFRGTAIYNSKYNGSFVLRNLYLYKKEESDWGYSWNQEDYKYLVYTTLSYNYTQFEKPSKFTEEYSDFGIDLNNNSLYDELIINVSVYIAEEGDYRISGNLYENCQYDSCNYITSASNETHLQQGINIMQLKFDGENIYKSNYNGKFLLKYLYLYKKEENYGGGYSWNQEDYKTLAHMTSKYNYTQFEKPPKFTDNYSDFGIDLNNNSLYDELVINVSVYANEDGKYRIYGYLYEYCGYYYCDYITYAENETYLKQGINIVQLKFDGEKIYKSNYDGKFVLKYLSLDKKEGYGWNQLDYKSLAYTTASYNYTQFEKPPQFTDNYSDFGIDLNNNSLYDELVINVSVYANEYKKYRIYGYIYEEDCQSWSCDHVYASNETHLKQGTNIVQLKFDGREIYKSNYNGKFVLKYLYLYKKKEGVWNNEDNKYVAYTTLSYNYTQFERPQANFTGNYSDFGIDLNNNSLYDELVINVSIYANTNGTYQISGELYEDCNSGICKLVTKTKSEINLTQGINSVMLKFNGKDIYKSNYNGKFVLNNLQLIDKIGVIDYRYYAAKTNSYNSQQFEHSDVLIIGNWTSEQYGNYADGNKTYKFLLIQFDLNASKSGEYIVSGEIYDKNGTYVSNYAANLNLIEGVNKIATKFKGKDIYNNGINGNFYLKNLYVKNTYGENLDYKDDAYASGYYNYASFLLAGGCMDFNNDENVDIFDVAEGLEYLSGEKDSVANYECLKSKMEDLNLFDMFKIIDKISNLS
ncbi:hypothetical protein MSIBF_A420002 [groundwater metagenome]|uniref:Gingipain domain-containing protein n=1 Tax=groundwater metagenome TaxID=717931 RepID=A0A098EC34_9ZZZZ